MATTPSIDRYREQMRASGNFWPAGHDRSYIAETFNGLTDGAAQVLTWSTNGAHPHDDMLAAWLELGIISDEQAVATSNARRVADEAFLAAYRANPPQPSAEELTEMRAAFGAGATVVNAITGERIQL